MKKREVDRIDIQILNILQENAYINNKDLAEKIGLSPSPTLVRIQNLQEKGIIAHYTIEPNYGYFGYTSLLLANIKVLRDKSRIFEERVINADCVTKCLRLDQGGKSLAVNEYWIHIMGKSDADCKECIDNLTNQNGVPMAVFIESTLVKTVVKNSKLKLGPDDVK